METIEVTHYQPFKVCLDALEFMHAKNYAHADIKASNLLHNSLNEVYLVDFGLARLFRIGGAHSSEKADPKARHNGTLEFCSRDAHDGLPPSRRGDLEILAYNLIHWLARVAKDVASHSIGLPWCHLIPDPKLERVIPEKTKIQVAQLKKESMTNPVGLLKAIGLESNTGLLDFVLYISKLGYVQDPDYNQLRNHLKTAQNQLASVQKGRKTPTRADLKLNTSSTSKLKPVSSPRVHRLKAGVDIVRRPGRTTKARNTDDSQFDSPSPRLKTASRSPAVRRTNSKHPSAKRDVSNALPACRTPPRRRNCRLLTPSTIESQCNGDVASHARAKRTDKLSFDDLFSSSDDDSAVQSTSTSKKKSNSSSSKSSVRRCSGWCQTSPELLMIAKAEALGRKALGLSESRYKQNKRR